MTLHQGIGRLTLLRAVSLCGLLWLLALIGCSAAPGFESSPAPQTRVAPAASSTPDALTVPHVAPTYFISAPQRTPTRFIVYPTATATPDDGVPRVTVGDNYFEPPNLTVKPGTFVQFVHSGNNTHTVTSLSEKWSSLYMGVGTRSELEFSEPGEYRYICSFHSGMFAIITVKN